MKNEGSQKISTQPMVQRDWHRDMLLAGRADGIYVYDADGKRYIDGSAGAAVVSIGHGVKEVIEAIYRQAQRGSYFPPHIFVNQPAMDLARLLVDAAPGEMRNACRVWFGSDGSGLASSSGS